MFFDKNVQKFFVQTSFLFQVIMLGRRSKLACLVVVLPSIMIFLFQVSMHSFLIRVLESLKYLDDLRRHSVAENLPSCLSGRSLTTTTAISVPTILAFDLKIKRQKNAQMWCMSCGE